MRTSCKYMFLICMNRSNIIYTLLLKHYIFFLYYYRLLWWKKTTVVLQEATSQLPPETRSRTSRIPEDVGFEIMTDVLNQNLGRRHGKVVWGMRKARVRETGASSSRSNTAEVDALKEEVTHLRVRARR